MRTQRFVVYCLLLCFIKGWMLVQAAALYAAIIVWKEALCLEGLIE
jgi:hypothetical protein